MLKSEVRKTVTSRRWILTAIGSLIVASVLGGWLITRRPRETKQVREASETIQLPPPRSLGVMSVEEALAKRRSVRQYADQSLTLEQVSQLLWAAQGITEPKNKFRAAPSAGGTYPLELYVVVGEGGVVGLAAGVYYYSPHDQTLNLMVKGDLKNELAIAALDQEWVAQARIYIVITAVFERTKNRYGERGTRYVYMEAGHAGENIYLQAASLGLGTVVVGAFYDEQVQSILKLPEDQKPLYIAPVGYPT